MKLIILTGAAWFLLQVLSSPSKFRSYLDCTCGQRKVQPESANLVTAGTSEASSNEFPWAARLEIRIDESNFQCGGTLVTDRHILTAAHCVNPGNQSLYVTVILGRQPNTLMLPCFMDF